MKTTVPKRSESSKSSSPSTGWTMLLGCMFVVYALVVIRIILFKGAPLYNLFVGAGMGTREVSLIPFASTIELFTQQLGMGGSLKT
ncbi:hypothetical protein [Gorillibacterium sp. CAU 1737]|uniref:hypothetical protein n=1 Tax=Gorillibacterium sp. CAU 1737 TaxID=3140362 RepID=UPI003260DD15